MTSRQARGFTLIEVLAALAIAGVAGMLAFEVMDLSAARLGYVRRAVQDPPAAPVLARMRDDLATARSVRIAEDEASAVITRSDGSVVEWSGRRGAVVRRDPSPAVGARDATFRLALVSARFREVAPGLVEVRLVRRVAADDLLGVGGALAVDREELRVEALRTAIRGARGGAW